MNLFVLDYDHTLNAQFHVDKHVVKMPVEALQILCTNIAVFQSIGPAPYNVEKVKDITRVHEYKPTHINHPCTTWARQSLSNFNWVKDYCRALLDEYYYRYNKPRLAEETYRKLIDIDIPDYGLTPFAQAMPDIYKHPDIVEAYRNYYAFDKERLHAWKNREKPYWL